MPIDLGGEVNNGLGSERLATGSARAQTCGEVDGRSTESVRHGDRFASVKPDADFARQLLGGKARLQVYRCAEGLARRDESNQSFVAAQLQEDAVARRDYLRDEFCEACSKRRARLVPFLSGVRRITPNIGDHVRTQVGRRRGGTLRRLWRPLWSCDDRLARLAHVIPQARDGQHPECRRTPARATSQFVAPNKVGYPHRSLPGPVV